MIMKNKKKKSKSRRKALIFYRSIGITLLVSTLLFLGLIYFLDILPAKFFIPIVGIFGLINAGLSFLLLKRNIKVKIKKVATGFGIFLVLIMLFASIYLGRTLGFFMSIGESKTKIETYSVIVLKNSEYKELEDIKNKTISYYSNTTGIDKALNELKKQVNISYNDYMDPLTIANDLIQGTTDVILIEESIYSIIKEEISDFDNKTKVIYTFTIETEVESTTKEVNVTKEPFNVYISGIDTYGKISSVSRSDVNIVMTVNPKTKQILLTSIPRDYYVQLHNTTGLKDKLTHAGIYGVDMSIQTIEDLLGIEINYYVKVNFTSVIDIVNALGNINVYSEYTFTSVDGYHYQKGYNKMNGEEALSFARERKAFAQGDRQRGIDQQAVIEAIIRKAVSPAIITKYNSLLNSIEGKFHTNMSSDKIRSIIKKQLNDNTSWNITSNSLEGSDGSEKTYTASRQYSYVMIPDEDSVKNASKIIKEVIKGTKLDSSYGKEQSGQTVTQNNLNTPQDETDTPTIENSEVEDPITDNTNTQTEIVVTLEKTNADEKSISVKTNTKETDSYIYSYTIDGEVYSSCTTNTCTFDGLNSNTNYYIQVTVTDSNGNSGSAGAPIPTTEETTLEELPPALEPTVSEI